MYDSHNHLQRHADPDRIVREMQVAGVEGCVANGTGEDDWDRVAALVRRFPGTVTAAYGVHPWKAHQASVDWETRLLEKLDADPHASVGEIGLDGWIGEPSLDVQRPVFLRQLAIARERQVPVTIHALKAWDPLFEAFQEQPPPERLLMHSFGGSAELAKRLADLGAWFSFSGYFLHPRKAKTSEAYRAVPTDRLLVESDAPDMMPPDGDATHRTPEGNHPANVPAILSGLARVLDMEAGHLADITAENHRRFFSRHP